MTGVYTYFTGAILRFGKMNYNGADPTVENPTEQLWFNKSAFSVIPSGTYVIRSQSEPVR